MFFFYQRPAESYIVIYMTGLFYNFVSSQFLLFHFFIFHSIFFPPHFGSSLEMLDKTDPPLIPDGYCMSVAYACLLDVVRSISLIVENISTSAGNGANKKCDDGDKSAALDEDVFSIQLVNSSWCGLLAALTLLLEAR